MLPGASRPFGEPGILFMKFRFPGLHHVFSKFGSLQPLAPATPPAACHPCQPNPKPNPSVFPSNISHTKRFVNLG